MESWGVALTGAIVGLLLALTGAGGSMLAGPMLIVLFGLDVRHAAPVALLAVALASGTGSMLGLRQGQVRYRAAMLIATTGIMVMPLGLWLAQVTPDRVLLVVSSGLLLWVGWRKWFVASERALQNAQPCLVHPVGDRFMWNVPCVYSLAGSGGLAGFLSGLLGLGGGFVVLPALQHFSNLRYPAIIATTLSALALISLTTLAFSAGNGLLDLHVALPFALGAIAGMVVGMRMLPTMPKLLMQRLFSLLAAIASISLLWRAWAA
ncbi:sulfite exporter TauE/SafE family protein [Methylovorus menthalis]|uniref:sulfite exporter TauE/SafE family protein n=1 Tax=Methylovorus menthalis TaxID=1002227 RepID=UPI001E4726EF|nr:sulfite exporter TauE/SafE family protein [Methylovorus menthalis]MCB4811527.1 sulfite exporter TauE/SafE family protein [Methylovorus menthalis]